MDDSRTDVLDEDLEATKGVAGSGGPRGPHLPDALAADDSAAAEADAPGSIG